MINYPAGAFCQAQRGGFRNLRSHHFIGAGQFSFPKEFSLRRNLEPTFPLQRMRRVLRLRDIWKSSLFVFPFVFYVNTLLLISSLPRAKECAGIQQRSLSSHEKEEECARWTTHVTPKGSSAHTRRRLATSVQHVAVASEDFMAPSLFGSQHYRARHPGLFIKLTSSLNTLTAWEKGLSLAQIRGNKISKRTWV